MELGKEIGRGQRSVVYAHPTNPNLVIKKTSSKTEIEVLEAFQEDPEDYFVTVHQIERVGNTVYAVLDRVENPDFRFKTKSGENFFESKFNRDNYFEAVLRFGFKSHEQYISEVKNKVTQPELVEDYYRLIRKAVAQGCDFSDTAWNLGFKNGKFLCFDTSLC